LAIAKDVDLQMFRSDIDRLLAELFEDEDDLIIQQTTSEGFDHAQAQPLPQLPLQHCKSAGYQAADAAAIPGLTHIPSFFSRQQQVKDGASVVDCWGV
jgi:hypothetical protein